MALANALQIAPGDLQRLPVPAPANGHTDSTTDEVRLAVMVHVQGVSHWLRIVGAPLDLRRENDVTLAYRLAEERDTPIALGPAAHGATRVLLAAGAFELAKAELAAVDVPTTTPESTQLAGMLTLSHSLVAAADSHRADADATVEHAAELAQRTGESLNPDVHPYRSRQSSYWRDYGRALARVRGRHDDAVLAFRRAETIHPHRVQRDPFAREVLAELLTQSRRDAVGR